MVGGVRLRWMLNMQHLETLKDICYLYDHSCNLLMPDCKDAESHELRISLYRMQSSANEHISESVLVLQLYLRIMYNLYLVSNLAVWRQQINKLYLLT